MLRLVFLSPLLIWSSISYGQDITDEKRTEIYLQCTSSNGTRCCDNLTAELAETLSVCNANSNGPKRRALYAECVGNPAGDSAVTASCCGHLNDDDAKLLEVCSHKKSGITWNEVKQAIDIAAAAFRAYHGTAP